MKFKNKLFYLFISAFMCVQIQAQNTNPVISNVGFSISGSAVTVTYDVTDAAQTAVTIVMQVSSNGGTTWDYDFGSTVGDIGSGISTGTGKTITWYYPGVYNDQFNIRIIANDETEDGNPCDGIPTVTYGSKTYNTIQIGDQCWLKENLDIGTRIAGTLDQANNSTIEKYCYNDLDANCTTYGGLYQWAEAIQYQNGATNTTLASPPLTGNVQGICPTGWHIPTIAEFTTLQAVGGSTNGNALKEVGQGTGSGIGTNTSGFAALFTGARYYNSTYSNLGSYTFFWKSTEGSPSIGNYMYLYSDDSSVHHGFNVRVSGFSVRCLKD